MNMHIISKPYADYVGILPALLILVIVSIFSITRIHAQGLPRFAGNPLKANAREFGQAEGNLCYFNDQKLESFITQKTGSNSIEYIEMNKNADGSKLYLTFRNPSADHDSVAILSPDGKIEFKESPGWKPVFDDQGRPIFWLDKNDHWLLHFNNSTGPTLRIAYPSDFVLADGCHAYVYSDGGANTSASFKLFTNQDGVNQELDIPKDIFVQSVFQTQTGIWVFGQNPDQRLVGLSIASRKSGLEIINKIIIPWAEAAVDLDPASGMFLVRTRSDLFPRWYLYNVANGKSESLGFASGDGIFLRDDMAYAVKNIFNLGK
jgi:hypothetical protein